MVDARRDRFRYCRIVTLLVAVITTVGPLYSQADAWDSKASTGNEAMYTVVRISPETVVAIGGRRNYPSIVPWVTSNEVIACSYGSTKPEIRHLSRLELSRAGFPAVLVPGGSIYAFGGFPSYTREATSSVEAYSLTNQFWTEVGDLIDARGHAAAIQLDSHRVLVFGGLHPDSTTTAIAEIYDVGANTSREVAPFPYPCCKIVTFRSKDRILACAGDPVDRYDPRVKILYEFDPTDESWHEIGTLDEPVVEPSVLQAADGNIWLVGGGYRVDRDSIAYTASVQLLVGSRFIRVGELRQPRFAGSIAQLNDDWAIVVGGATADSFAIRSCEYLSLRSARTYEAPSLFRESRYGFAAMLVSGDNAMLVNGSAYDAEAAAMNSVQFITNPTTPKEPCDPYLLDLFSGDQMIELSGDAERLDDEIILTPSEEYAAGAIWMIDGIRIGNGFETTFVFSMSDGTDNELADGGSPGADGVALVVQSMESSMAPGEAGQGIGYQGARTGCAIEFDAYQNGSLQDPSRDHIALNVGGRSELRASHAAGHASTIVDSGVPELIADGREYHVRVVYDGEIVEVYLGVGGPAAEPLLREPLLLESRTGIGPADRVRLGITAATGFSMQVHALHSWMVEACRDRTIAGDVPARPVRSSIVVVPSPSTSAARVLVPEHVQGAWTLTVVGLDGTECYRETGSEGLPEIRLPVDRFATGIYVVRLLSSNGVWSTMWSVVQ